MERSIYVPQLLNKEEQAPPSLKKEAIPMQLKVAVCGIGLGVPKITGSVSFAMEGTLRLKDSNGNENWLKVGKPISADARTGTMLLASAETDWINVDPIKDNWMYNPHALGKGYEMEIEVEGKILWTTEVDVKIKVFKDERLKYSTELYNVKSDGSQWASVIVRSPLTVMQPAKARRFKIKKRKAA